MSDAADMIEILQCALAAFEALDSPPQAHGGSGGDSRGGERCSPLAATLCDDQLPSAQELAAALALDSSTTAGLPGDDDDDGGGSGGESDTRSPLRRQPRGESDAHAARGAELAEPIVVATLESIAEAFFTRGRGRGGGSSDEDDSLDSRSGGGGAGGDSSGSDTPAPSPARGCGDRRRAAGVPEPDAAGAARSGGFSRSHRPRRDFRPLALPFETT
jgi:hypothetical protein